MSCRSCDLKRIYKLFEEKKRREAEAAELAKKQEEEKEDLAPEAIEPIAEEMHEEI